MLPILFVAIPLLVIAGIARRRFRKKRLIARCRRYFRETYTDWVKTGSETCADECLMWHERLLQLGR